ncbi:hypothetical protein [Arthrobacter gandavensis]|uniref:hypothetical protein n=1 Tax=Arthrobacter gandavensis TaxID=169960 RepID=UPI001E4A5132|nr:hypothetical protein [Arthrobacter gandavensis]
MKTDVRRRRRPSAFVWGIGGVLLPVLAWEAYKAVGAEYCDANKSARNVVVAKS